MLAFLKSLLPRPEPRGSVWITPFVTLSHTQDDLTDEERQTVKRIASLLRHYQDRMVTYADARQHPIFGIKRLQQISATWDIDADQVEVFGSGERSFAWSGPREEFMQGRAVELLPDQPTLSPMPLYHSPI